MTAQNTVIKHLIFLSAEMDAGNMWMTQVQGVSSRNRTFCTYCILLILSKYLNTCSNIFYAFMLLQLLNGSIWCLMPLRSINNSLKFLVIWVWVCFSYFSWCFGFCFGLFVCLRFIIVNVIRWFGPEFCKLLFGWFLFVYFTKSNRSSVEEFWCYSAGIFPWDWNS